MIKLITERVDQTHEFLSDYEAAQKVGPLPMINALLKTRLHHDIIGRAFVRLRKKVVENPQWDDKTIARRIRTAA